MYVDGLWDIIILYVIFEEYLGQKLNLKKIFETSDYNILYFCFQNSI